MTTRPEEFTLRRDPRRRKIGIAPPAILLLLYAGLIFLGSVALLLPWATTQAISPIEAAFTATSAVTVTGLVLFDTGAQFTMFGQFVIMVLIQLGGLGLMTFAVFVVSMLGWPIGLPHRQLLQVDLNQTSIADLLKLVWVILRVVAVCELVGVALLAITFVPEFGWGEGLWQALFHTISAFNNAGFGLFPDSLTRWAGDPLINIVVPAMFIVGGLGFSVWADLFRVRSWRKLTLHSKIMMAGTAGLLVVSVLAIGALEWTNPRTLGAIPETGDRLWATWFQATTTRTAGFNTVDIGGLHDSTSFFMMALMWIGGGSTSTAGGVKVTTFIVLLAATLAFFRRRSNVNLFGRQLGPSEVLKVLALTVVSMVIIIAGIFLTTLAHDGEFLDLAFEVVSAFGTVGLSRGVTPELDMLGQCVIMLTMFVGRVGPLTLGFFLATRAAARVRYPAGEVFLG